jgi:hypothetical protein
MTAPGKVKKGSTVIVVEGPHKGAEGKVDELYRSYDRDSQTTAWRCIIEVPGDSESGFIHTRLAWVRPI